MNKIIDIINSVLKLHLFKLFFKGTLTNSLIIESTNALPQSALRKTSKTIDKEVYFLQKGIRHKLYYLINHPKNSGTFFEESYKERNEIIIKR
jgi:hypothetical protein